MASSKASKRLLSTMVTKLQDVIENGETMVIDEKEVKRPASPAYFSAATNLLKLIGEDGADDAPTLASRLKELSLPFKAEGDDEMHGGQPRH